MWQIGGLCLLDVCVCGNGVIIIGSYTSCFHIDVLSGLEAPCTVITCNAIENHLTIVNAFMK